MNNLKKAQELIRKTPWIKDETILQDLLNIKPPVKVYKTTETGKLLYAVQIIDTQYWLDAFKTKKEAIDFCTQKGLKYDY